MHANRGLILSRNIVPACQIRSLIECDGLATDIVLSDLDAYAYLDRRGGHFLICDIDDIEIQGMAVAEWFGRNFRRAPWYAICRHGNSRNMRLARECGAAGYFFLNSAGLALDPHAGLTRELVHQRWPQARLPMRRLPRDGRIHPGH